MRWRVSAIASFVNLVAGLSVGLLVGSVGYLLVQHHHADYIAWRISSGYETADDPWVQGELAKVGIGERRVMLTGLLTMTFLVASVLLAALQRRLPPVETPLRRA